MKNFLKSFAIFACAALMFGACAEEGTEDVGGGLVTTPTISEILPGNQKAQITFCVDASNTEVSSCLIGWTNEDASVEGAISVAVEPGVEKIYTIQGGVDLATLTAGTYTFSVVGVSTSKVSNAATATVDIYDESTYQGSLPSIVEHEGDLDNLLVTWGTVSSDCLSVTIDYVDADQTPWQIVEEIETGSVVSLKDGNTPQTISYTASFKPADGIDEVEVSGGTYTVESTVVSPVISDVVVGNERFEVTWTTPADIEDVDYFVVAYGKNTTYLWKDAQDAAVTQDVSYNTASQVYKTTITGVSAGSYAFSIYSVSTTGSRSVAAEFGDGMFTIFDDNSYVAPALAEVTNNKGEVTITFEELSADCRSLKVAYFTLTDTDTATGAATIDLQAPTATLPDAAEGTEIVVTATFYPEEVLSEIDDLVTKVATDPLTIPYVALAAPINLSYEIDYTLGESSTITLTWEYTGSESSYVASAIVYYGDYSVEVDGNVGACTLSTTDTENTQIVVDTEYEITVVAVNGTGIASEKSEAVEVTPYNENSYSMVEPDVAVNTKDAVITVGWALVSDLDAISIVYAGDTYEKYVSSLDENATIIEISFDYNAEKEFAYTAYFTPEKGQTEVEVAGIGEIDAEGIALADPTDVTAKAGVDEENGASVIYLTWKTTETYASPVISYGDGVEKTLVSGDYIYSIEEGVYSYTITEDLASETSYTVSLTMVNSGLSSNAIDANAVTTYSKADYTLPTATIEYIDNKAYLVWDYVADQATDLQSLVVTYNTDDTSTVTFTEGSTTNISTAEMGSTLNYVATYCPEDGVDDIELTLETPITVPTVAFIESMTLTPTYVEETTTSTIEVAATLTAATNPTTYVYYKDENSADDYSRVAADVNEKVVTCSLPLTAAEAKESTYSIYIETTTNVDSDSYTTTNTPATVEPYGSLSYSVPAIEVVNNGGEVTATWTTEEDLQKITYLTNATDATEVEVVGLTETFTKGDATSFTYTAYFCPEDGEGDVTVTSGSIDIPLNQPESPVAESLVLKTSYDESGSYITATWELPTDNNITDVMISSDGGVSYVSCGAAATTKTLTLAANETYTIMVKTVNSTVDCATPISGTATTYNANSYDDALPTVTAMAINGDGNLIFAVDGSWSTDLTALKFTYDTDYNCTVTEGVPTLPTIAYVPNSNSVTYTATFCPTDGATDVVVASGSITIDTSAQDYVVVDDVYLIFTAKGLSDFATLVNGGSLSIDGKLMKDIDLSDLSSTNNWTPIGNEDYIYAGVFDGNDMTISNMHISSTSNYQALFGYISGSSTVVRNIKIVDATISGAMYVAAITGNMMGNSKVEGCEVSGNTVITATTYYTGGVAGNSGASMLKDCKTTSTVSVTSEGNSSSAGSAGGIVGTAVSGTIILGCNNAATVIGKRNAGGITGYAKSGSMIGCGNTGSVSTTAQTGAGIIGRTDSQKMTLVGCYNTGSVYVTSSSNEVGGISGCANYDYDLYGCYNTGSITSSGSLADPATNTVGELLGYMKNDRTYNFYGCYINSNSGDDAIGANYTEALTANPTGTTAVDGLSGVLSNISAMNTASATGVSAVSIGTSYGVVVSTCVYDSNCAVTVTYSAE